MRRAVGALLLIAGVVMATLPAMAGTEWQQYIAERKGNIIRVAVPGRPPATKAAAVSLPESNVAQGINILYNVPAFNWCYGCSPTSAGMICGYYDRTGFPNMYTGPANGGVCPLNNSLFWTYTGVPPGSSGEMPMVASHMGFDGRTIEGHVDDYWINYGAGGPDPHQSASRPAHANDSLADFMGTSQWWNANSTDGNTYFFFDSTGNPLVDYTGAEPGQRDGCHGWRLFVNSRGYSVPTNFNQLILPTPPGESNVIGYTFNDFKADINAGRPVMIQVAGHSMVGFGYNDTGQIVYIHDTWDHANHSMTWGSSYSGLQHYGVSVLRLNAAVPGPPVMEPEPQFTPGTTNTVYFTPPQKGLECQVQWAEQDHPWLTFGESAWFTGSTDDPPLTSYTVTGLTSGSKYFYRARCRNAAGVSNWSNVVSSTQDASVDSSWVLPLAPQQPLSGFLVSWFAEDSISGVDYVQLWYRVQPNGVGPFGPWTRYGTGNQWDWPATSVFFVPPGGPGRYEFYTIMVDNATNVEPAPAAADQSVMVGDVPAAPVMIDEPTWSPGLTNRVYWNDVATETGYYVEWSESESPFVPIGSSGWLPADTVSYMVTALTDGRRYYYRVRARNDYGEGPWSNVVSSTQDASIDSSWVLPLSSPQPLTGFWVSWFAEDSISGVDYVELWYRIDPDGPAPMGPWTRYGSGTQWDHPQTSVFFDPALCVPANTPGRYEFYSVMVDNASNREDPSPPSPALPDQWCLVGTAPVGPVVSTEPPFTQGLTNQIAWTDLADETDYWLEWADSDTPFVPIGNSGWLPANTVNYTATGLMDGVKYYYRLKARNPYGESPWSNVVSSTQDATAPASAINPVAAIQPLAFPISWVATDATSGVQSVQIWFTKNGGPPTQYDDPAPGPPLDYVPPISSTIFDASQPGMGAGTYRIWSIARDNASHPNNPPIVPSPNVEADPGVPFDITVSVSDAPPPPVMNPEPTYTRTTTNNVSWTRPLGVPAFPYQAYVEWGESDSPFVPTGNSGWITVTSTANENYTATGLTDARKYFYRVKVRQDAVSNASEWSNVVSSTQDTTPPVSEVNPLAPNQPLTFPVSWTATDATSGVNSVQLWYRFQPVGGAVGPAQQFGTYDPSTTNVMFTSPGDGWCELWTIAVDNAFTPTGGPPGNVEAPPVPPPGAWDERVRTISAPVAPVIDAEPAFTKGLTNVIRWGPVANAHEYYLEWAITNNPFTPVGTSGWFLASSANSFEATGLTDGQIYFYRVKARDLVQQESAWSNVVSSTQDATAPVSQAQVVFPPPFSPPSLPLAPFQVNWTSNDPPGPGGQASGIWKVQLWCRFNYGVAAGGGLDWYLLFDNLPATGPVVVPIPYGAGTYEFYTIAFDNAYNKQNFGAPPGPRDPNIEAAPAQADTFAEVGCGNVLTWDRNSFPAVPQGDLKLGAVPVTTSGWYPLAKPAGGRIWITVTRSTGIRGVITQYQDPTGTVTPVLVRNYLQFTPTARNGTVNTLAQTSSAAEKLITATYYRSLNRTRIGNTWYNGAWELTHEFVSTDTIKQGQVQFTP